MIGLKLGMQSVASFNWPYGFREEHVGIFLHRRRRTPVDTFTISPPGAYGSGELKKSCNLPFAQIGQCHVILQSNGNATHPSLPMTSTGTVKAASSANCNPVLYIDTKSPAVNI